MLEGKSEKLEFQEMLNSPHWKIEMSKNKTKMSEKWTKRNGELKKMKRMRDEWKDNEKWSFMKLSLVKITLKHNLGLFTFLSEPRTQAYITYLKSPFWLNMDT